MFFKAFSFRKLAVEVYTAKIVSGMGLIPPGVFALFSGLREQKQLGFAGGVFLPQVSVLLKEKAARGWMSFCASHAGTWLSVVLMRLGLSHWPVPAGATGVSRGSCCSRPPYWLQSCKTRGLFSSMFKKEFSLGKSAEVYSVGKERGVRSWCSGL